MEANKLLNPTEEKYGVFRVTDTGGEWTTNDVIKLEELFGTIEEAQEYKKNRIGNNGIHVGNKYLIMKIW